MMVMGFLNYHQIQEPRMSPCLIISGSEVPLPIFLLPPSGSRDGSFPNTNHNGNSADCVAKTQITLTEKTGARFNVVAHWHLKYNVQLIPQRQNTPQKVLHFLERVIQIKHTKHIPFYGNQVGMGYGGMETWRHISSPEDQRLSELKHMQESIQIQAQQSSCYRGKCVCVSCYSRHAGLTPVFDFLLHQ